MLSLVELSLLSCFMRTSVEEVGCPLWNVLRLEAWVWEGPGVASSDRLASDGSYYVPVVFPVSALVECLP